MTIEAEVANLTSQTTALLTAVNVAKAKLDQKVADATTQAGMASANGAAQVVLAAAEVALSTAKAMEASAAAASASAAAAASDARSTAAAAASAAAGSYATAANTALLALGSVLANGIGAVTVDADGNLTIAYNTPTVTSMAIDASGNLSVTYPS